MNDLRLANVMQMYTNGQIKPPNLAAILCREIDGLRVDVRNAQVSEEQAIANLFDVIEKLRRLQCSSLPKLLKMWWQNRKAR